MSEAVVRVAATVRGRVQGVAYRANAARAAERVGLTGWVMNQDDGSVRLEAQGSQAAVDRFLVWCRKGPPMARVTDVDVESLTPVPDEVGFEIRA